MTTHGGARLGAGRPQGGISNTRRLITRAITKGLATAGKSRHPDIMATASEEEAAIQTGAMIVSDMIQAGQGNDVMKLWAVVSTKETHEDDRSKSKLAKALSYLPGSGHVADMSKTECIKLDMPEFTGLNDKGTTHTESRAREDVPYFAPQIPLAMDDPE